MPYLIDLCPNNDGIITFPMSRNFRFIFLAVLFFPLLTVGQNPISVEFNEIALKEEFSEKNKNWPYLTTMENLYVADKDEYFMHRRHKTNPYAIITQWKNNLSTFNILTTLKLGPSERADQTIGVIFLVQGDGKGAIVFEFNKFKQYRIKQLVGSYYKFISGDSDGQGWVKSGSFSGKNEYNEIDIRVNLPQVDIYLNKKFLQSFDVMDYKPGNMGLLVGADTKAKSDYFYVYATPEAVEQAEEDTKKDVETKSAVEQLSKLRYELEQEKRSLRECELERQAAVSRLEEELALARQSSDRIGLQNRQLQEFKNQVLMDVDEDVFLTLAQNLKAEIIKNQRLESQVQIYRDSLKLTHTQYSRLKLALLDKAIKKAEKKKVVRDKKESADTKAEIERELEDKRMKKEQAEWEKKNADVNIELAPDTNVKAENPAPTPKPEPEIQKEARPLPVTVRKARKKEN